MRLFITDLYKFLITGTLSNQSDSSKKNFFINAYFLKWIVYLFFALFTLFVFEHRIKNESHVFDGDNLFIIFLNVVILAPILEEVLYRYHTKLHYKNVVLSIITSIILFYDSLMMLSIIVSYFVILLVCLKLNIKVKQLILVYISTFLFGVSHVIFVKYPFLFENFENSFFVFGMRFFSGFLFCYVFHKKGILSSIIFHSIWNLGPFLLVLLRTRV